MKHILAIVVWAFFCGMVAGFYICFFTLFRRALIIAKDCVATSNSCIAFCKEIQDELTELGEPLVTVTHSKKKERIH